jgi:exodeoxyribonuclease VII large subunit
MLEIKKEDIFSVSDVNKIVKNLIDQNLPILWVEGEVANFTAHSSGHIYFSLKDKASTLRCAFFRQYNIDSTFFPKDGDKILCLGKLAVYEKTGSYQILVRQMLPAGIGELQLKFNALKEKLTHEGLFAEQHKKRLPEFPESIGIITSPTGAAYQDIKNILTRRFPCHIFLYPASVQGENAVPELISGIRYFNRQFPVDVLIIGRGGGSQEDLFCFNDEQLAREIFSSDIPVISAVGHEIDFTIADFVADLRAPTPSAAAELAVPDKSELSLQLKSFQKQLNSRLTNQLLHLKTILKSAEKVLYQKHPRAVLFKYQQLLDETVSSFSATLLSFSHKRKNLTEIENRLTYLGSTRSAEKIHRLQMTIELRKNSLVDSSHKSLERRKEGFLEQRHQLLQLSPYEALKRGYAVVRQNNKIINSVEKLKLKESLEIILQDGTCQCKVESKERKNS